MSSRPTWGFAAVTGLAGFATGLLVAALLRAHDVDPGVQETAQVGQVRLFLRGFVAPLAQHLQRQITQAAEVPRAEHAVDPPPAAGPHFDHSAVYPG